MSADRRRGRRNGSTLVFLHLPKTAGTTLTNLLAESVRPSLPIHQDEGVREFLALSQEERDSFRFVHGHMPYGIHRFLGGSARYITFLRHPVDRVVSSYHYTRATPDLAAHEDASEWSLEEFASRREQNALVRRLGLCTFGEILTEQDYWWKRYPSQLRDEHVEIAKEVLRSCDFVGLQEHFDDDVFELFKRLELRQPSLVPRLKVSRAGRSLADEDPEAVEVILDNNRLDLELWEFARELREARVRGLAGAHRGRHAPGASPPAPASSKPGRRVSRRNRSSGEAAALRADSTLVFLQIVEATPGTALARMLRDALTPWEQVHSAADLQRLLDLPSVERRALRFLSGAMPYGIHRLLEQDVRYCTFLRDPVDRVLAVYRAVRATPRHPLHERASAMTAGEFARTLEPSNRQVRQLGLYPITEILDERRHWWLRFSSQPLGAEHLEIAKEVLGCCDFVGVAEYFEEDVRELHARLGLMDPQGLTLENMREGVSDADVAAIEARNELDLELYSFACSLRRERIAAKPKRRRSPITVASTAGDAPPLEPALPFLLAHVHIPRTGGTTLSRTLRRKLPRYAEVNDGRDLRRLLELDEEERRALAFVSGQMPYGVHRLLERDVRYCTFLRHPVDRVLSAYEYARTLREHPLHDAVAAMSAAEFARTREPGNSQVRRFGLHVLTELSGQQRQWWQRLEDEPLTDEHLEAAKEVLACFDFVGLQEHFEEDVHRLYHWLSLPAPRQLPHLRQASLGAPREGVDAADLEAILARNRLDLELYDYAGQLREHQVAGGAHRRTYTGARRAPGAARAPRRTGTPVVALLEIPEVKSGPAAAGLLEAALRDGRRVYNARHVRRLLDLPRAELDALRLVHGELPWGIHRLLEQDVRYCTFLRDPVDRVLAAYERVASDPGHPWHERAAGMSAVEFARMEAPNQQVRRLGLYVLTEILHGSRPWWLRFGPRGVNEEHLEIAKEVLRACDFVGLEEQFEEDVATLFERLELPPPGSVPALRPVSREGLDPESLAAVAEHNRLDMELYAFARSLRAEPPAEAREAALAGSAPGS